MNFLQTSPPNSAGEILERIKRRANEAAGMHGIGLGEDALRYGSLAPSDYPPDSRDVVAGLQRMREDGLFGRVDIHDGRPRPVNTIAAPLPLPPKDTMPPHGIESQENPPPRIL